MEAGRQGGREAGNELLKFQLPSPDLGEGPGVGAKKNPALTTGS